MDTGWFSCITEASVVLCTEYVETNMFACLSWTASLDMNHGNFVGCKDRKSGEEQRKRRHEVDDLPKRE